MCKRTWPSTNASTNTKVLGKLKDECAGRAIVEYGGLRPKMYSILKASGGNIKKAKGVKKATVKKHISHEQYKEALFKKHTLRHGMDVLRSAPSHLRVTFEQGLVLNFRLQALDRKKCGGHAG